MKNTVFTYLAITLLTCGALNFLNAQQALQYFDEIRVSGSIDLEMVAGSENSVEVEKYDNLKIEVNKGVLKIKRTELWKGYESPLEVRLQYQSIHKLSVAAGASVRTEGVLKSGDLELNFNSGANCDIEVEAESVDVSAGEGANVFVSGSTNSLRATTATGANLDASDLESNHTFVKATTGGNVQVTANSSIEASASTGGNVNYHGNPSKVQIKEQLGGSVNG